MKWKKRFFATVTILFAMLFAGAPAALADSDTDTETPSFDPNNFVQTIDNPYFPLTPGTTFIYRGETDGTPTRDVMKVTWKTKEILGVTTTVVHDRVYEEGILVEDTFDWYAQDKDGNVWYFGEATKELDEHGNVISTEGSWEAGVDGAQPGIIMLANPQEGDTYQQEFAPDVAEDMAKVLGFEDSRCVRYGCFENALVTQEWTPLEPGVAENKYYAPGVGFIYGETVKGGDEYIQLVKIRHQSLDGDDGEEDD